MNTTKILLFGILLTIAISITSCNEKPNEDVLNEISTSVEDKEKVEAPEYFMLRPE